MAGTGVEDSADSVTEEVNKERNTTAMMQVCVKDIVLLRLWNFLVD